MKLIHFVELNFKLTQYCIVSWYYLVSWYFSWYSIIRHFYGIVTTLISRDKKFRYLGCTTTQKTLETIQNTLATAYSKKINTLKTNRRKYCRQTKIELTYSFASQDTQDVNFCKQHVCSNVPVFFHCCFALERGNELQGRSKGAWTQRFCISWPKPMTSAQQPFRKSGDHPVTFLY